MWSFAFISKTYVFLEYFWYYNRANYLHIQLKNLNGHIPNYSVLNYLISYIFWDNWRSVDVILMLHDINLDLRFRASKECYGFIICIYFFFKAFFMFLVDNVVQMILYLYEFLTKSKKKFLQPNNVKLLPLATSKIWLTFNIFVC